MFQLSGVSQEPGAPRPLSACFHLGEAPDVSLPQVRGAEL